MVDVWSVALRSVCAFVLVASVAVAAAAQTAPASPQPAATDEPAIDFRADVHADSVRFDVVPKNAHVDVSGVNSSGGTVVTRTNIPRTPVAGTTYRNVGVTLHVTSRFHDPNAASPRPSPKATPR